MTKDKDPVVDAMQQKASGLALTFLEEASRKGKDITIPSLGIVIKGDKQPDKKQKVMP